MSTADIALMVAERDSRLRVADDAALPPAHAYSAGAQQSIVADNGTADSDQLDAAQGKLSEGSEDVALDAVAEADGDGVDAADEEVVNDEEVVIERVDAEQTEVFLDDVDADNSAPEPEEPAKARERERKVSLAVTTLMAKGFTREEAEDAVATACVTGTRQRRFPSWAPATHLFTKTFFAGRSDEQIQADLAKHVRNDGGQRGVLGAYAALIAGKTPEDAAAAVAAHADRRLRAIRVYLVAGVNELRRRSIERAGGDVNAGPYLRVR